MPEGRFVSKSISTSGQLKKVSLEADFLFGRMIPHLDRDGRLDGDPDVVKALAVPLRGELTPELIGTCLAELDAMELVVWYEVDGQQVLWFPAFTEHQQGMKPDRERPSRLPSVDTQGVKRLRRSASGLAPDPVRIRSPQVKSSKVKSSPSERYAFMGELRPVWKEAQGGEMPKGSARDLEELVTEHGLAKVTANLRNYVTANQAPYATIPKFKSTFGTWDTAKSNGVLPLSKEERDRKLFKQRGWIA